MEEGLWGYMGNILRIDLSRGLLGKEALRREVVERYVGGAGFGTEYLYREVPPGVEWDDPENRVIIAAGPLGGTVVSGTGTFCLVTKGPMTNLAITTQANGFLGAYLKFAGYDAIIIHGRSPRWVYLYIDDKGVELRDAAFIVGMDTMETEKTIRETLKPNARLSVYAIGVAGENLVRFSVVVGDRGHVASKNGCGCVLGAKRLKAIAVARCRRSIPVWHEQELNERANALDLDAKTVRGGLIYKLGTGGSFTPYALSGLLPVKNYTTNLFPEHQKMNAEYMRTHFQYHSKPCWACRLAHSKKMTVTEGAYVGYEGEEPDYENMAAFGPMVGNSEPGAVLMLSDLSDRLGMDTNEIGWIIGWVMECLEKGILTRKDLDGIVMNWGNVEGIRVLLERISRREGIGNLLAEGVKRASEKIGGEAAQKGIYVLKGVTPRGHDHRSRWGELLDTCVSATGSLQAGAWLISPSFFGMPPIGNQFSPWEVAASNAKLDGWYVFLDCLGICRFTAINPKLTLDCVKSATGMELNVSDALTIGRRIINKLRVFNFRHGLNPDLEAPSSRYGSTPTDGPAEGKAIGPHFQWMKSFYFELMGWDPRTGKPLPYALRSLGLEDLVKDLDT